LILALAPTENDCECKMTVEYDCPESFRSSSSSSLQPLITLPIA